MIIDKNDLYQTKSVILKTYELIVLKNSADIKKTPNTRGFL